MVAFYHLVLLLLAYLTTPINAATYDLADSVTAERFFANSNINVAYDEDSNAITWTAQTPLAVGCGASVLIADETVGKISTTILSPTISQFLLFVHLHLCSFRRRISMAAPIFRHDGSVRTHN
jgi:hypothetical protein